MDKLNINYTNALYFLTVVKHMNMNRAAQELYITQPALSLAISRLEKELGITLFYREKNKLLLSHEGEKLLPYFEQFRQAHDVLVNEAVQIKHNSNQSVTVSFSDGVFSFFSFYFSNLLNDYEKAIIKVCYVDSAFIVNMLLANQIDFAISATPIRHPLISTILLLAEPIGIVLPTGHSLADKLRLSWSDLEALHFHGLSRHNAFRMLCDKICQSQNITPVYETEDEYRTYTMRISVNEGKCAFFSTVQNFDLNFKPLGNYVFREVDNDILNRKLSISFLTNSKIQYRHQKLIELIQESVVTQGVRDKKLSKLIFSNPIDDFPSASGCFE